MRCLTTLSYELDQITHIDHNLIKIGKSSCGVRRGHTRRIRNVYIF